MEGGNLMSRDVKLIFGVVATPIVIWCLVTGYFIVRSLTDKGMKVQSRNDLTVWVHPIGGLTRYGDHFPIETVKSVNNSGHWLNSEYKIDLYIENKTLAIESSRFVSPVNLKYDGWKWQGFANTPGRKLPLKVEVW
jgi:hypothetical protein